ncbi:hypothetical protein FOA52_008925 [Chlamydomonas sp. UWO 241]|nr:hypothetical protein FOA52_008925 [Chlamydomonas sp. UWO 241]
MARSLGGGGGRSRLSVVCMAHPRRVAKVAAQVQREISDMLHYDSVLQSALAPERATGLDQVISVVPSITHVYVSNDLQVVKMYVSIYSDGMGRKRAMANLKRLEPYVRREMGSRVPLRLTPEYRFEYDNSADEQELVERVIGAEDVARYRREAAAEAGVEGEEAGFFEDADADAEGGDADGDGFFDEDEDEGAEDEGEYEEVSSSDVFNRPGPFDDLFTGVGDNLISMPRTKGGPQAGPRGGSSKSSSSKAGGSKSSSTAGGSSNGDGVLRGRRARGAAGRVARQQQE